MTKATFSRIAAAVLFATTLSLGACKQGDKPEDALASDTSLAHDLQLANADTMSQPELKDVPATVAPEPATTADGKSLAASNSGRNSHAEQKSAPRGHERDSDSATCRDRSGDDR